MTQMMLAETRGFEKHNRATRKAKFLARMEGLMRWVEFCALIDPHYPKADNGWPPVAAGAGAPDVLHCQLFNLSDMACENALIVDVTLIAAPPSTKNQDKARDPEMHQTKKGKDWHFGMKLHIGADSETGLVHSANVTAANVHDNHEVPNLLHGQETRLYGDSAYRGKAQLERLKTISPKAKDFAKVRYRGRTKNVDQALAMLAMLNINKWGQLLTGAVRPA